MYNYLLTDKAEISRILKENSDIVNDIILGHTHPEKALLNIVESYEKIIYEYVFYRTIHDIKGSSQQTNLFPNLNL